MCTFASMKRVFVLIATCFTLGGLPLSALSIDSIFARLPITEFSLLTTNNRLDLLDYANSGMTARVENLYRGNTELTVKKADYLHIAMTPVSRVEMFLLPYHEVDTIIGILSTITSPVEESKFNFYNLEGNPIAINFPIPTPHSLVDSTKLSSSQLELIDFLSAKVSYLYDEKTFVCQISMKSIPIEEKKKIETRIQEVRFKWDGEIFVKE